MEKVQRKISDEKVLNATGKNWDAWFTFIDEQNGKELNHKGIVAILNANTDLSSWWQQSVTVEYEIARGKRKPHEMVDGFQISKGKTIPYPVENVYRAWMDKSARQQWMDDPDFTIRKATENKSLRITWIDEESHVDIHFYPKDDRTQISVNHKKLTDSRDAVAKKVYWTRQIAQLSLYLSKA